MIIDELLKTVNTHVPFNTAESWDNVGLLIGDKANKVTGILTALDCTEEIVDEAIKKGYNTIICHHPLIFKGIKNITQQDGYGLIIRKLIQHDVNLIALHTNLDVHPQGVNAMLSNKLGLKEQQILNPETISYYKVQVFIPEENLNNFKDALSEAGVAQEGDYQYCFFESKGTGQFKPVDNANPHIGEKNQIAHVDEYKLEFMIEHQQRSLTQDLITQHHPYETPVYDFIELKKQANYGLGMIGKLSEAMTARKFVDHAKSQLKMPSVRFSGDINANIETVAIIGGSGIGFEYTAKQKGADIFVTGDIKHHDALDAKIAGVNLLDINHYSEYVMREGLCQLLEDWLNTESKYFNIEASVINTDPFEYL
ncbi:Nif3-like dinuclear metal center hexameric protein [Staphylococcus shinii]|uniref:Nif3-like dinuclear metal center hexameric protein n=1 Tax=Staphylococcus TaxID=1279 RepID=UPI000C3386BC|nr:Nif3-like dinuclear metal center hexameric protein [Staphylococcus shinii]MBO3064123.1 Nif3-like dinuclear metal center hexameric protein [Staphylococcus shinii]MEC5300005.1 Nif3-like dinuclear metal center hexameric protein [Staphylococcus shinii]PKI10770.1 Nif3-like dinuclear metal center hexameric protein [Staphylococcus shinii]PKI15537.1 Nif3-like dinuclear metal center hexameric protein [Staphylococcus shinii]